MSLERVKSDASRSTILFKWKNSRSCQTTPFMSALLLQLGLWLFVSSFQSPYTPQYNAACLIPEKFFSNDTRYLHIYIYISQICMHLFIHLRIRENRKFSETSGSVSHDPPLTTC